MCNYVNILYCTYTYALVLYNNISLPLSGGGGDSGRPVGRTSSSSSLVSGSEVVGMSSGVMPDEELSTGVGPLVTGK